MKTLFASLLVSSCCFAAVAQETLYEANDYFRELKYHKAIPYYLKAWEKKPTLEAASQLAECYRELKNSQEAEKWYGQALEFREAAIVNHFWYAMMLKENGKYSAAKEQFISYGLARPEKVEEAKFFAFSCDEATALLKEPAKYDVESIDQLNTSYSEFSPFVQGGELYFTSNRDYLFEQKIPIYEALGTPYFKVYKAHITGTIAGDAIKLGEPVNNEYHNGPVCFTPNGDAIYFTRTSLNQKEKTAINTLEIYYAVKDEGSEEYTIPRPFDFNHINYSEGHPNISHDGMRMYFVSDKPEGQGGTDIYVSKWQGVYWSDPVNLGPTVNTPYDEQFPFESDSGVLYFASNGHGGIGGFDLYRTTGSNTSWSKPKNLLPPLNSPRDDFGIFFLEGKEEGYFSSNRNGGKGSDDIYYFNLNPFEKQPPLDTAAAISRVDLPPASEPKIRNLTIGSLKIIKEISNGSYFITGTVSDVTDSSAASHFLLADADILVINKSNGDTAMARTNVAGEFKVKHQPNVKRYVIRASKPGYFTRSVDFEAKDEEINVLAENSLLENIEYEFNDYRLKPQSMIQLDKIVDILNIQSWLSIEMQSYTDARGTDEYNRRLSQKRAKSAADYLAFKGIDKKRISSIGQGETNPIIENAQTEEDHQLNRRTEFKLINKPAGRK